MLLERVDELVKEHAMTRAELERKLDLSQGSIRNWNKSMPSVDKIQKVADYFDVSLDYLLGRSDSRKKTTKYTSDDLDKMLDNAMSFDGKPMTDHDREVIRAYLEGKFGSN